MLVPFQITCIQERGGRIGVVVRGERTLVSRSTCGV